MGTRRGVRAADLDDLAQEVFLRLLRYDREHLVADPRGYLFKVAANVTAEWSIRARHRFPHEPSWLESIADEVDLAADLESAERAAELHCALASLPARAREILRLHYREGLTHQAISARLGVSRRVVKRDIIEAYTLLRMSLSEGGRSLSDIGPTS
jgi:RNA polymerase sigma-70 factor (ECF subfamily)